MAKRVRTIRLNDKTVELMQRIKKEVQKHELNWDYDRILWEALNLLYEKIRREGVFFSRRNVAELPFV